MSEVYSFGAPAGETKRPSKRPPRKQTNPWRTRIAIGAAVVVALAIASLFFMKKPLQVETVQATRGPVRDEISSATAGEVMPEQRATVRGETSGRVLEIPKKRGERARKGEVVVALDAADLQAKLKQAQAQVVQARAHARAAAVTAARDTKLAARGAETAKLAQDMRALSREAAAAAKAAEATLDVARVARAKAAITAPFDGIVADVFVGRGDEIQPGLNVFEIVDASRLHVEAAVDEADIGRVHLGQRATLRLDALPGHAIEGRVNKLDPTVRRDDKGARTLRIEVSVVDLAGAVAAGLRPGMSANVDVRVDEKSNVLRVPTSVIIGRGTRRSVYVVRNGIAVQQEVTVGLSSWENAEITSGIEEGAQVISSLNIKDLADGASVKVAR